MAWAKGQCASRSLTLDGVWEMATRRPDGTAAHTLREFLHPGQQEVTVHSTLGSGLCPSQLAAVHGPTGHAGIDLEQRGTKATAVGLLPTLGD